MHNKSVKDAKSAVFAELVLYILASRSGEIYMQEGLQVRANNIRVLNVAGISKLKCLVVVLGGKGGKLEGGSTSRC